MFLPVRINLNDNKLLSSLSLSLNCIIINDNKHTNGNDISSNHNFDKIREYYN